MSKVFVSVGMSLDGFLAGPNGGPKNPLGDGGTEIHLAPIFLGKGMRLFDQIDKTKVKLEIVKGVHSPLITHLQYNILSV